MSILFHFVAMGQVATSDFGALPASVKVNRTIPRVEPPRNSLESSASPTAQDIFQARVFEDPLVPIGANPTPAENAALAKALLGYAKRSGPDDFSSLTEFLKKHPESPWQAALLTGLGFEYYNTAHYSKTLEAWSEAWKLAKDVTDAKGKAIADRAVGELAYMYARLGRMTELEALLKSVEGRVFLGPATERISGARQGLSNMKDRPEIAFRCGPLALHRIKLSLSPKNGGDTEIYKSASTQKGFSLPQVAELSKHVGLNYQMAFREKGAAFVVPSVVHWKVGHYAAMIRQEGDRFLLQDPTFQNDVWATRQALEDETSGYFLVAPGPLPQGWRGVEAREGGTIWGKGNTCCNDPDPNGCEDPKKSEKCGKQPCKGMAVANVHLMLVSLNIVDQPLGYHPPVGPPVDFNVTYNHREANQPATFTYANLGSKWTFDWLSYIKDNPLTPSADVKFYMLGGGTRTFTGFNTNTQSFASQQFDQTRLTRTSATSYELVLPDGSRRIFNQSDGSTGSSRKIFLTQLVDPSGNAISLTYDSSFRVVALADAIGQVTTISYNNPNDIYKITKVTDPFGRFATFDYDAYGRLTKITDVIGLTSQFVYEGTSDFINALITPYGTNTFIRGESGTTRWLETVFPDGERDRVEYNQSTALGTPFSVLPAQVPTGMATRNEYLWFRNTYYWSKISYASTYPDYTKAKVYHWLHTADLASTAGILESEKEPLEGRVWYDYVGQSDPIFAGNTDQPTHIGRVLDDGTTQLYTYQYNEFGNLTNIVDPVGRTVSYTYAANGIDLLETRQTRAGNNELLSQTTYNGQHLPLTERDAAGQVTAYTYNPRGQLLTQTEPNGATTTNTYNTNGYLIAIDGPLAGPSDTETITYDAFGRNRTETDVSGYTLTYDYDALDRVTKITYPDGTFDQFTYDRLDQVARLDRAGRLTTFEHNRIRELTKQTDPLNRVTRFEWCKCGDLRSVTDPMGRTTSWRHDVQGRLSAKVYADGTQVNFVYENTTSRPRQRIDEKGQVTQYTYYRDDALKDISYPNALVPTPAVTYAYDANYERVTSMTDGTGTTRYQYAPITGGPSPGAGQLSSVDGPLPNDTIVFTYDALGRRTATAINGIATTQTFDSAGRLITQTNALGSFGYAYEGSSFRISSNSLPNGQTETFGYGSNAQDRRPQRITRKAGATPITEFLYGHDVPKGLITSRSQQFATQTPAIYSFNYDATDQLLNTSLTDSSNVVHSFGYSYDPAGNRLTEQLDGVTNAASYNVLNELTASTGAPGNGVTNEWDAEQRLVAVQSGNQRTEFTYDGMGRRVGIRQLVSGSEISNRRFLWCDDTICEERDTNGVVTKRFFGQGVKMETGATPGNYFYARDHLGSIHALTDAAGNIRARYSYDPYGRRTNLAGDVVADFGFAGMFWSAEAGLNLTLHRAYDPALGRWLSRDPLRDAELEEGHNLYAYVHNDPVNHIDPLGLKKCCDWIRKRIKQGNDKYKKECASNPYLNIKGTLAHAECERIIRIIGIYTIMLAECERKPCTPPAPPTPPKPPEPAKPKTCPQPQPNA